MRDYFITRRRKLDVITLVFACMLMVAWPGLVCDTTM